jgi:3-dehydroquinate dehydratase I
VNGHLPQTYNNPAPIPHPSMKIVASVQDIATFDQAVALAADIIELRLDLMGGDITEQARKMRGMTDIPLIATMRSREEGGAFEGDADSWNELVHPIIPYVDYVDVETRYKEHVPALKSRGVQIIASLHTRSMPARSELEQIEASLRSFGDLPKIVVQPGTKEEVIDLLSYVCTAKKPLCVSIMGEQFRFVRAFLPLFGSELVYCHTGTPTSPGQYRVDEFRQLIDMLK